jgi:hypothetical protein
MMIHTWPSLVGPHEIFERHSIKAISRVIEVSQRELQQVHRTSKDGQILHRFAAAPSFDDELFAILWKAFLVDLLIRGKYHDEAARLLGGQVLHHPARGPILRRLSGSSTRYDVTNADRALSNVILAGALAERTQQRRMDLWLEGVFKARKAAQYGTLSLVDPGDDEAAERAAVEKAKELGIRTHARVYDDVTDASIAIGAGVLTSFVLTGWIDIAISVAMYAAAKSKQLGNGVGDLIFERRHRLERFAASGSGRVEREWS